MGERNFLVNQAILVNSSQQNARNAAQLRKKRMRQQRARTGTKLPQLPLSPGGQDGMSTQYDSAMNALSDMPIEDEVMISGRGSQLDPVRVLKDIFKQPVYKKRRPGVNRIAEKYKNLLGSASANDQHSRRGMTAEPNPRESLTGAFQQDRLSMPTNMANNDLATSTFYSNPESNNRFLNTRQKRQSYPEGRNPILLQNEMPSKESLQYQGIIPPSTAPTNVGRIGVENGQEFINEPQINMDKAVGWGQTMPQTTQQSTRNVSTRKSSQAGSKPYILSQPKTVSSSGPISSQHHEALPWKDKMVDDSQPAINVYKMPESVANAHQDIRDKLDKLRYLFEEEDENQRYADKERGVHRPNSSEWDLQGHKIMYQEAMDKRKLHLEQIEKKKQSQGVHGGDPIAFPKSKDLTSPVTPPKHQNASGVDMKDDELRDFLMNRIAELKSQTSGYHGEIGELNSLKYRYKASTISNILSSHPPIEVAKLEDNYKARFHNKTGIDPSQKFREIDQQKKIQRKMSDQRISAARQTELNKKLKVEVRSGQQVMESESSIEKGGEFVVGQQLDRSPKPRVNTDLIIAQETANLPSTATENIEREDSPKRSMMHEQDVGQNEVDAFDDGKQTLVLPLVDSDAVATMPNQFKQRTRSHSHQKTDEELDPNQIQSFASGLKAQMKKRDKHTAKQNYYTQVIRQIERIDRDFSKKEKMRKQGGKQEFMQHIEALKQEDQIEDDDDAIDEFSSPSQSQLMQRLRPTEQPSLSHTQRLSSQFKDEYDQSKPEDQVRVMREEEKIRKLQMEMYPKSPSTLKKNQSKDHAAVSDNASYRSSASKGRKLVVGKDSKAGSGFNVIAMNNKMSDVSFEQQSPNSQSPKTALQGTKYNSTERPGRQTSRFEDNATGQIVNLVNQKDAISDQDNLSGRKLSNKKLGLDLLMNNTQPPANMTLTQQKVDVEVGENFMHLQETHTYTRPSSVPSAEKRELEKELLQAEQEADEAQRQGGSNNFAYSGVAGAQMSYFCPKRFNRFPRFTIFFKKGEQIEQNQYVVENTVSLNADFLKFLVDKRHMQSMKANSMTRGRQSQSPTGTQASIAGEPRSSSALKRSIHAGSGTASGTPGVEFNLNDLAHTEEALAQALPKIPSDVAQWNNYLKQKNFDPFDKVVLVKGIDNSILTSYRTLKGENNTVSDTFKIVHKKFLPGKTTSSFYKQMLLQQVEKMPYQVDGQGLSGDEAVEFDFIEEQPDEYGQPEYPDFDDQPKQQHQIRAEAAGGQQIEPTDSGVLTERIAIPPQGALNLTAGLASSGNLNPPGHPEMVPIPRQDYTEAEKSSALRIVNQMGSGRLPQAAQLQDSKDVSDGKKFRQSQPQRRQQIRPKGLFLSTKRAASRSPKIKVGQSPTRASPDYAEAELIAAALQEGIHGVSPLTKMANAMLTEQQKTGRHNDSTPASEPGTAGQSPGTLTAEAASPITAGRYAVKQHGVGKAAGKYGTGLPFPIPIAKQGSGETFSNYPYNTGSQAITEQTHSIYKNADLEEPGEIFLGKGRAQGDTRNEHSMDIDRQKIDVVVLKKVEPLDNVQFQNYPLGASASAGYDQRVSKGKQGLNAMAVQSQGGVATGAGNRDNAVLRPTIPGKPRNNVVEQVVKQQQHQLAAAHGAVTQHKPFTPKVTKHRPRPMDLNQQGLHKPVSQTRETSGNHHYGFAERSQSMGQSPASSPSAPARKVFRQERIDPQTGSAFRHYEQVPASLSEAERLGVKAGGGIVSGPFPQTHERLTETQNSAQDVTMTLKDLQEVNKPQQSDGQKCYPPQVSILKSSIREEESRVGVEGTEVTHEEQVSSYGVASGRAALERANHTQAEAQRLISDRNKTDQSVLKNANRSLSPRADVSGHATDRPSKSVATHVGVLKVPDSLKGRQMENLVEQLAQSPAKKGAVSYLIDEIYSKERKYVKNVDKDNFLNAKSPIFQLDQFRHLKSNTGVEKRDYSRLLAHQQKQEAERKDVDLSLQCTTGQPMPRLPAENLTPVQIPEVANSAATFASAKTQEQAEALINQITKADSLPSPLGGNGDPGTVTNAMAMDQDNILMGMRNESALAPTNLADRN